MLALIIVDVAVIWTAAAMNKAIIDIIAVRIYGALPNLLLIISGRVTTKVALIYGAMNDTKKIPMPQQIT